MKVEWQYNSQFASKLNANKSQEKIKTFLMQNFGGQTKSIMVFLKVAYGN